MSSTSNPKFEHQYPGVSRPTRLGTLLPVGNQVSQIRGGAIAGSTLGGAPARGQEVHASVAPASSGNTSSVSVTFHCDPSDVNFSQAKVYVSGYQGNKSRILVAASDSGPITFVLNNSGASISLI